MQLSSVISPLSPITTRMDTVTEEDCTTEVMTRPISSPRKGLAKACRALMTAGSCRSCPIAADMVEMPTNRMPKPMTTSPSFLKKGCLM